MTMHHIPTFAPPGTIDEPPRGPTSSAAPRPHRTATPPSVTSPHGIDLLPEGGGFTVTTVNYDESTVVTVTGDLDLVTAPVLSAALTTATASTPQPIIVDLTGVTFLACAAIAVLVYTDTTVHPSGLFGVVSGDGRATTVPLHLTGCDDTLTLYPNLCAATTAVARHNTNRP